MAIQWSPALSVGVADIDDQHQELFRRAERLIVALRAGDRSEVGPLVGYLSEYVVAHFAAEERLMRDVAYPGYEAHAGEHARFREQFEDTARGFEAKGPTSLLALTLHNWISDWLRRHIGGADLELGRFVRGRGR